LVLEFNPPLPKDATLRARKRAHTEGVKKKKDEEKKKRANKAMRKEEREKRRRRQRTTGEDEEESSDDEDDDEERSHDWLDAFTEEDDKPVVEHTPQPSP
jgi:FMN phosphatase YigB (HAD superfamily)